MDKDNWLYGQPSYGIAIMKSGSLTGVTGRSCTTRLGSLEHGQGFADFALCVERAPK